MTAKTPFTVVVHRTEAEAAKSGNVYTARAECVADNNCTYKSRWSHQWKAEEAAAAHTCDR
jgi:hypothetical protein